LAVVIRAGRNRTTSKLSSTSLHTGTSASFDAIGLGDRASRTSADNVPRAARVSLGILETEELKLCIGNLTLESANIRRSLRNLILVSLQLTTKGSTLRSIVKSTEGSVRVSVNVILNATNSVHQALSLTAVLTIESIIILSTVLVLEVNGVQHNLGLADLLLQLLY
jgi:hypothetical protein